MATPKPTGTLSIELLAAHIARAEGCAFVILRVDTHHGVAALHAALPSLDADALDAMDGATALRFAGDADAQDAFTRLSRDLGRAHATLPGSIDASVHYVGRIGNSPVVTTSNSTTKRTHHVFVDGGLRDEDTYARNAR